MPLSSGEVVFATYEALLCADLLVDPVFVSISMDDWVLGKVPSRLRAIPWENVAASIFLCFDGLDDDPREVYEVPEIRDFCRDAIASCKGMIRRMGARKDAFGAIHLLAAADLPDVDLADIFGVDTPFKFRIRFVSAMNISMEAVIR